MIQRRRQVFVIEENGLPETHPLRVYLLRGQANGSLKLRARHGSVEGLKVKRYVAAPELVQLRKLLDMVSQLDPQQHNQLVALAFEFKHAIGG